MTKLNHDLSPLEAQMGQLWTHEGQDMAWLQQIFLLFSLLIEQLTENDSIGFTTLFSRIAYLGSQHGLKGHLAYEAHYFRKTLEKGIIPEEEIPDHGQLGLYLIYAIANEVNQYPWTSEYARPDMDLRSSGQLRLGFKRVVHGILLSIDETSQLTVISDDDPDVELQVALAGQDVLIHQINKNMTLPLSINLIDVTFLPDYHCTAKAIVLRPDLLLGVTSVSECFSTGGTTALRYLGRKLIPSDTSVHMLIGNIVNHFLDELIHDPDLTFSDVVKDTFQISPESFSLMTDNEVMDCMSKVKVHFNNLKKVVTHELADAGITKERSYLEPSFYSNEFGLQGRLDLYHHNERAGKSDIVELKSGKLYQAHKYGLNQNHYIQTLLYDLLLESVYDGKIKSTNYILYSGHDGKRLRFAPKVRDKQIEALNVRNKIIQLEEILTKVDQEEFEHVLARLDPEAIPTQFNFLRRDAKRFWDGYGRLSELERIYFRTFLAFISREFQMSKIGRHGIFSSNGLASLWLDPMAEKADMFTVLTYLEVSKNDTNEEIPCLTLTFSERSNRLSKFRVGDITVLYPYESVDTNILSHQLFKCTILELSADGVKVRLRARQKNFEIFRKYKFWNIESDVLDSGFNKQFHGMYDFMVSEKSYRDRMLCLTPPAEPAALPAHDPEEMTDEQRHILNKAISAQDYFLLWGPPGTGKTSVMIHHLVKYLYEETEQQILLLAYTNRAVDEICAAIHDLLDGNYIRIGSRYSTDVKYKDNLLSNRITTLDTRAKLREVFATHRVFVSTISSFQGKREMKLLKKFDVAIIDEASQLLEPMLVGMLSAFRKFILIGDHRQLPAVVTQNKEKSKVSHEQLRDIGLVDCRMSLFERMYKQCTEKGWDWACGALTHQGRMHQDIVQLISKEFYDGRLDIMQGIDRLLATPDYKTHGPTQKTLVANRLIFIDTPKARNITRKTNHDEAVMVSQLVQIWQEIYAANAMELSLSSIGVITPFRSQIAMIKSLPFFSDEGITIDTVERYQGGARDRIIISLAVNEADLLDAISNVNEEGIDRKLNVALTRAREHIIILGNKGILMRNPLYARLIESCVEVEFFR